MEQTTPLDLDLMLASEAARELVVSRGTIVLWDKNGTLTAAVRTSNGTRLFLRTDVERLKRARLSRKTG